MLLKGFPSYCCCSLPLGLWVITFCSAYVYTVVCEFVFLSHCKNQNMIIHQCCSCAQTLYLGWLWSGFSWRLRNKAGGILYFSHCQQVSLKHQNQQWTRSWSDLAYSSVPQTSIKKLLRTRQRATLLQLVTFSFITRNMGTVVYVESNQHTVFVNTHWSTKCILIRS